MNHRSIAKLITCLLSASLLMSACAGETRSDPDLYVGDLGVERVIYERGRPLRQLDDTLLDPHGFPLIRQTPNPSIPPADGGYAENVIEEAKRFLGTPYEYGSDRTDPATFDCSDFTRWAFLSGLGMALPWTARSQAVYVKTFSKHIYTSIEQAKRGDLLFFSSYLGEEDSHYRHIRPFEEPVTHTGIYLGGGKLIHSPSRRSGGVRIDVLNWRQLDKRFLFGGGILD